MGEYLDELLMKNGIVSYNAECIRKKSNFSKSSKNFKFDSDTFDPEELLNNIPERSPKLDSLLKNIASLDETDMKRDGHMYKHFIFCDVKSGSQGARMLASALIANGFHMGYTAEKKGSPNKSVNVSPDKIALEKVRQDTPRPSDVLSLNPSSKIFTRMEKIEEGDDSIEGGGNPSKKKKENRFKKIQLHDMVDLKNTKNSNFYLLSSVDVYDQPISVKIKKEMFANFNSRPSNVHGEDVRIIIMDSGFKEGVDLFDIKYVHIFEPSVNTADQKQVIGRGTRTCGQKGLTFHPTRGWPLHVFVYDMSIPEPLRKTFLDSETTFDLYLKSLDLDIRLARFASDLEETSIYGAVDYELNREVHTFKIEGVQEGGGPKRRLIVDNKPPLAIDMSKSSLNIQLPSGEQVSGVELKQMDFKNMRDYIQRFFSDCKWTDVKMENMCDDVKKGGATQITYTPTQRFVKQYFTPQSPVKGMLLWHSTGTGKTCSAIASATSTFDPQGYTILWVTRATLKNDIWKNMFDQICNEQIRTMIADGIVLPEEHAKRMRMLSKAWKIRPISYKQFTNLVSKENNYYKRLTDINGEADPLRKTLLVIDEAHKLYGGGDLSSLERPDMKSLHNAIMKSYSISGRDSVRLLLMTATPITENPMELVKLVNLCKPIDDQIPDEFTTFSDKYLNEEGGFTSTGRREYLDNIAGHISYLNREKDARQFAQPHLKRVIVPMVKDMNEVKSLDKQYLRSILSSDVQDLKSKITEENTKIDDDLKDLDSTRFYALRDICDEYDGVVKKGCVKIATGKIRELVKEARAQTKHIKDTVKSIREEIKNKNLYRKEALKELKERVDANPEELSKFKDGMYYTLKHECGKTISKNEKFDEIANQHPEIATLVDEINAYDKREADIDNQLQIFADSHKKRTSEMKKMLRSWELNEMEQLVVKSTLKDEQKQYRNKYKEYQSKVSNEKQEISKLRNKSHKRMRKRIRSLRSTVKNFAQEHKYENKEKQRAEKQLRKTLRKQGTLREEFKEGALKELMKKYDSEVKKDLEEKMDELQYENKKKELERAKKEAEKEEKRKQKDVERAKKEKEKEEKHKQKGLDKIAKQRQKELEKVEKQKQKEIVRNTKTLKKAQDKLAKKKFRITKKIRFSKKKE